MTNFTETGVPEIKKTGAKKIRIDIISDVSSKADLRVAVRALDRVLCAEKFWIPQWYKDVHTVAYFDMFEHPEPLPPYSLGYLDFWWVNPEKEAKLKAEGAL